MKNQKQKQNDFSTTSKVKFGILTKLLLGTIIPLIIVLIIIGSQLNSRMSNTVKTLDTNYLTAESMRASQQITAYFQRFVGIANLASQMDEIIRFSGRQPNLAGTEERNKLLTTLKKIQSADDTIAFTWLYNINSKDFLQSDGTYKNSTTFDATSRIWYNPVINSEKTIVTGGYEDIVSGKLIVTVATPVYINGKMTGIFGVDVLLEHLTSELAKITIGDTGYVTVFDTDNNVIFHPNADLIMKNVSDIAYSDNVKEAILGNQSVEGLQYTRDGETYNGSTIYLSDFDYLVLGILPHAEYQAYIADTTKAVVLWFAIGILILAVIIIIFSLNITRSVKKLSVTAGKIADGDLDVSTDISSHDEIGQLSQEINAITGRLKEYILYIDEITAVLGEIGKGNFVFTLQQDYKGEFAKVKTALLEVRDTISRTLKSVVVAADQVLSGAEQVATGAQSQAQGATEQASGVQELAATLQDVSQQIDNNTAVIQENGKDVEQVAEEVHEGEEKMSAMLEAMDSISENSQKIENIIKNIEDIAFQTNILALNAAVEAARAGQAGKGFAVVADEVRNLAAKTAEASKTTAELIQQALSAVGHGKTMADETALSFRQISEAVKRIAEKSQSITLNSQKQDEAIRQTALGVDQISSVVQTNSATAEQSAAASEELSGQAQELKNLVAKFQLPDCAAPVSQDTLSFEQMSYPQPSVLYDSKY